MTKTLKAFWHDESGVTAIEYSLIASGIGLAIIAAVTLLGARLTTTFTAITTALGG